MKHYITSRSSDEISLHPAIPTLRTYPLTLSGLLKPARSRHLCSVYSVIKGFSIKIESLETVLIESSIVRIFVQKRLETIEVSVHA